MVEYIERAAVLEASKKSHLYFDLKPIINSIPTADVRLVVRGKWLDEHPDEPCDPRLRCSVCKSVEAPLIKWCYCPVCGSLMEE